MRVGIAIDRWKLPIFERHLSQYDYTYFVGEGLTSNTLLLRVETENVEALETVVRSANTEAAKTEAPK